MSTADRDRWLQTIAYEFSMLDATSKMAAPDGPLRNMITESRVLHARNLCEFCTPRNPSWPDDIKPENLFDEYPNRSEYSTLLSTT